MVSFCCEACNDIIKKPKAVVHYSRCHAPLTCLDCNKAMPSGEFQKHVSCISEAQKVQGHLFKGDKPTKSQKKALRDQQAKEAQRQTTGTTSQTQVVAPISSTSQIVPDAEKRADEPVPKVASTEVERGERKRKRKEEKHAKEGEIRQNGEITSDAQFAQAAGGASAGASLTNGHADGESTSEPSKKKKKSKSKSAEIGEASVITEGKPAEHPADALERVLVAALKLTGESITLKDVLEKAKVGPDALQYLVLSERKKKWQMTVEK